MSNIPVEYQLVIDELVEFWQTRFEPCALMEHAHSTFRLGCDSLTFFFLTVRDDLRIDKRSKYAASSAFEFKQFLEIEYRRLYQLCAERQAEAQVKAEKERRARAELEAQSKEMVKAATRAAPIELRPKSKKYEKPYEKPCWNCGSHISSAAANQKRCRECGWFICSECGSCKPHCISTPVSVVHDEAGDPFLPDFPDE